MKKRGNKKQFCAYKKKEKKEKRLVSFPSTATRYPSLNKHWHKEKKAPGARRLGPGAAVGLAGSWSFKPGTITKTLRGFRSRCTAEDLRPGLCLTWVFRRVCVRVSACVCAQIIKMGRNDRKWRGLTKLYSDMNWWLFDETQIPWRCSRGAAWWNKAGIAIILRPGAVTKSSKRGFSIHIFDFVKTISGETVQRIRFHFIIFFKRVLCVNMSPWQW